MTILLRKNILLLLCVLPLFSLAQNGDCRRATEVTDIDTYHALQKPNGYGKYQENIKVKIGPKYIVLKETKGAWYHFICTKTGTLAFTLQPDSLRDDYDFLMFQDTSKFACLDFITSETKPIRANLALRSGRLKGATGLDFESKKTVSPKQAGNDFGKALQVIKGEQYFIFVQATSCKGGYKLSFRYKESELGGILANKAKDSTKRESKERDIVSKKVENNKPTANNGVEKVENEVVTFKKSPEVSTPSKPNTTTTKPNTAASKKTNTPNLPKSTNFKISGLVTDATSQKTLKATIILHDTASHTKVSESITDERKGTYNFLLLKKKHIQVSCFSAGYNFATIFLDSLPLDSSNNAVKCNFVLNKVKLNDSIIFTRINFSPSEAQILPNSKPELEQLLFFMKYNPDVKVEIQGHVNNPKGIARRFSDELSTRRARSVLNYLILNGIDKDRLTSKGYGNGRMLFPNPKNEKESIQNRRVEVVVVETKGT